MASPEANAALARHFLQAYAARDLATIAGLISDDALLRDWNLERRGREAFLAETRHNVEQAASITIDIEHLHATSDSVVAELLITVDREIRLRVVDVFDIDASGRVSAVRSYKGLDP